MYNFISKNFNELQLKKIGILTVYLSVLIFVLPPNIPITQRISFLFYGLFIIWILWKPLIERKNTEEDNEIKISRQWFWIGLILFSFLLIVLTRLFMFFRYGESPLGYDTGTYWEYFTVITIAGTSKQTIVSSTIAYTQWFPFFFLRLSPLFTIQFLHIVHQLLTAGAIYFLARSLPGFLKKMPIAAITIFLFATSINQFMTFWWMFYKQSASIPFLLIALGLFFRRSWLAIPVGTLAAAIHFQSALPLGFALGIFLLFILIKSKIKKQALEKEWYILMFGGIVIGIFLFVVKGPQDIAAYLNQFLQVKGLAINTPGWNVDHLKGLFIAPRTATLNTMFYLPFSLLGFLTLGRWIRSTRDDRLAILSILALVLIGWSLFPLLYQNRMFILLDLVMIVFAAPTLFLFLKTFAEEHTGRIFNSIFIIIIVLFSLKIILSQPPQLYANEALELKTLQTLRDSEDYVMATTSLYTFWVHAYTGRNKTIAPGWLSWNKWDLEEWKIFWFSENNEDRQRLFEKYDGNDIYMFFGEHQGINAQLKNFLETDSHITQISQHIWRYTPQK